MSYALVQDNAQAFTTASGAATFSAATTAGNLLVALVQSNANGATITAPSGWSQAGSTESGGTVISAALFYLANCPANASSTTYTFAWSVGTAGSIILMEWSGVATSSPLDASGGTSGNSTTPGSGSLTSANANELLIAGIVYHNTPQTESGLTAGWTEQIQGTGASNTADALSNTSSSAGAQSASFTIATARAWAGIIAAFLPASGGGTVVTGSATMQGNSVLSAPTAQLLAPPADGAGNSVLAVAGAQVLASPAALTSNADVAAQPARVQPATSTSTALTSNAILSVPSAQVAASSADLVANSVLAQLAPVQVLAVAASVANSALAVLGASLVAGMANLIGQGVLVATGSVVAPTQPGVITASVAALNTITPTVAALNTVTPSVTAAATITATTK